MKENNVNFDSLFLDLQSKKIEFPELLKRLSDETAKDYVLNLTKLVEKIPAINEKLEEILDNSQKFNDDILFTAFFFRYLFS